MSTSPSRQGKELSPVYAGVAPEDREVLARVLKGSGLTSLVRQCAQSGDVEMLRSIKDAGRFAITADATLWSGRRVPREDPVLNGTVNPMIDAVGSILKARTSVRFIEEVWGTDSANVMPFVEVVRPSSEMRDFIRELFVETLAGFEVLGSSQQPRAGQVTWDEDEDFQDYRESTLHAMAAIAGASNDVELYKTLQASRLGGRMSNVEVRLSALGTVNHPDVRDLTLSQLGWIVVCNATDVLEHLADTQKKLFHGNVGRVMLKDHIGADEKWDDLKVGQLINLAEMEPPSALMRCVLKGLVRAHADPDERPAFVDEAWVKDTFVANTLCGQWPYLVKVAHESRALELDVNGSIEQALSAPCVEAIDLMRDKVVFPLPASKGEFSSVTYLTPNHPMIKLTRGSDDDTRIPDFDAALKILLEEAKDRGVLPEIVEAVDPHGLSLADRALKQKLHGSLAILATSGSDLDGKRYMKRTLLEQAEVAGDERAVEILRSAKAMSSARDALRELGLGGTAP